LPPVEQQSFQIAALPKSNNNTYASNDAMQAQIKAKKDNILKKLEEIKKSSNTNTTTTTKTTSVTKLESQPRQLFTLTRLLDYSPHPTTENILKEKPVLYNGKHYYFTVTYNEDWKEISADTTCLNGICFTFNVYENGKKVRNLTTPKVVLNPKKLKKSQTIGIAEVSPFKFNVKIDEITSTSKGIKELVFKLDLIG
ncbi:MAG: hypothetical protein J6Z11_04300, partial [Candidatus Riflebacteria bacterium]|nr:hypothetical protein [Candidatus Riflebacteria bacterium]